MARALGYPWTDPLYVTQRFARDLMESVGWVTCWIRDIHDRERWTAYLADGTRLESVDPVALLREWSPVNMDRRLARLAEDAIHNAQHALAETN